MKILIVDDEPGVLALLRMAFSQAGYEVRAAADPREAMQVLQADNVDVLLSDVIMPGIDGHELVRWAAEQYPRIRTVLMSGFDLGCQECPYSPRCKVLPKPFQPREAIRLVNQMLGLPGYARNGSD